MEYSLFLQLINKAGLNINEFAALLKMNRVSVCNYSKKGDVPDHLCVIAALMAEMNECGMNFTSIIDELNLSPKKKRGAGFGEDHQEKLQ